MSFENAVFDRSATNWIRGGSELTAEPAWKWYTAALKFFLGQNFRYFLVANFWITLALINTAFKKLQLSRDQTNLGLALMVPVVFPTIMFWSPRSSVSLGLCLLGVAEVSNRNLRRAIPLIAVGTAIHSQYIAVCLFVLIAMALRRSNALLSLVIRGLAAFGATLLWSSLERRCSLS